MKLAYQNENRFLVSNAENILRDAGIPVTLRNEYASGAMGELSPLDTWMQVWVINDSDLERAKELLESIEQSATGEDWLCPNCHEINGAAFEYCWKCHTSITS